MSERSRCHAAWGFACSHFCPAHNGSHDVIEVVGDSTGQTPDRFKPLKAGELAVRDIGCVSFLRLRAIRAAQRVLTG